MISISALTYKRFSFDLKFKYVDPFSQHYSDIIWSKMVNMFFSASLHMYRLSGTHMHRPEYRVGGALPMVIIRSLCIVFYLQYGLYSTIYSVSADIFMQEDTVKGKRLAKTHKSTHIKSASDNLDSLDASPRWSKSLFVSLIFNRFASYTFRIQSPINNDLCQFGSNVNCAGG